MEWNRSPEWGLLPPAGGGLFPGCPLAAPCILQLPSKASPSLCPNLRPQGRVTCQMGIGETSCWTPGILPSPPAAPLQQIEPQSHSPTLKAEQRWRPLPWVGIPAPPSTSTYLGPVLNLLVPEFPSSSAQNRVNGSPLVRAWRGKSSVFANSVSCVLSHRCPKSQHT